MPRKYQEDLDRPVTKRIKRRRPWRTMLMLFLLVLVVGLILLPKILTNRGILVGLVDRFGGLAPLKVDFERVQAGWFQPISVQGVMLSDGQGQTLIRVGSVETEKGILGWIMNQSNLGRSASQASKLTSSPTMAPAIWRKPSSRFLNPATQNQPTIAAVVRARSI